MGNISALNARQCEVEHKQYTLMSRQLAIPAADVLCRIFLCLQRSLDRRTGRRVSNMGMKAMAKPTRNHRYSLVVFIEHHVLADLQWLCYPTYRPFHRNEQFIMVIIGDEGGMKEGHVMRIEPQT